MKKITLIITSITLVISIVALSLSVISYKNVQSDSNNTEGVLQATVGDASASDIEETQSSMPLEGVLQATEGDASVSNIEGLPSKMPSEGWSIQDSISKEASEVFNNATKQIYGFTFTPVLVATQAVSGTNYSFLCKVTPTSQPAQSYYGVVRIYQPSSGTCYVTAMTQIYF